MQSAIARGLSKEEFIKNIDFAKRFSVDIGQEYMLDHVIEHNASALYDKLKGE